MVLTLVMAILGIGFIILGGTATLSNIGLSLLMLPSFLYDPLVIKFSLLIGGLLLLISSFSLKTMHATLDWGSIIVGLIVAPLGAFPLLMDYNMLGWLPFAIKFTVPDIVLSSLLLLFGLFMIVWAFKIRRSGLFFGG